MKKVALFSLLILFNIFWSCSDDSSSTEPNNSLPLCEITSPPSGTKITIGTNININVDASDSDGNIIEVRFYFDGVGIGSDNSFPYSFSIDSRQYSSGNHIVKAVIKDNDGEEDEDSIVVNLVVPTNNPPAINHLLSSETTVSYGDTAIITCDATDADSDSLIYTWQKTGGTISGAGSSVTWTAPNESGTYSITCTVNDGVASVSESVSVIVTAPANNNPVINSLTASSMFVFLDDTTIITCDATDADGDSLDYNWQETGGTITGSGSSVTWTAPSTTGTYIVTCIVSDGFLSDSDTINITVTDVIAPEGMIYVQGGTFDMGDHFYEGNSNELPVHNVLLSDYFIGKHEVTQAEWALYMPAGTYYFGSGSTYPVYSISWYDLIAYCNKRSVAEGLLPCYSIKDTTEISLWGAIPTTQNALWDSVTCNWNANGYRLPTEAEWEYAARGGIYWNDNYRYSGSNEINDVGWFDGNNIPFGIKPVGTKEPNQIGIYDMSGNSYEYCWDWYSSGYYQYCVDNNIVENPRGLSESDGSEEYNTVTRSYKGGCFLYDSNYCRVAYRYNISPYGKSYNGFRIVRSK